MKRMNRSLIYGALMGLGTATRAELAARTAISATTIRSLLDELLQSGDLLEVAVDASSGGRRARRYAFNPARNLALCLYFRDSALYYRVTGLTGAIADEGERPIDPDDPVPGILRFTEALRESLDIRALGVGVPGIVENGCYYIGGGAEPFVSVAIGERLEKQLRLPVTLENDLNCIALGFAGRCAGMQPQRTAGGVNIVYIHLNRSCSGAGIIADGKIVRGATRFAGEVGFLPLDGGRTLDELLAVPARAAQAVAQTVACLSCVTNPALVVLGGDRVADGSVDLDAVRALARERIPANHLPDLVGCTDDRDDYLSGISRLTVQVLTGARGVPVLEEPF